MKDCEKHLDRRERREEDIYRISTLVAGNFEIQEVLDRLAEAAVKVTRTTACSIRLLDENVGKLAGAFARFEDRERFARVVGLDEIEKNDWNLNIARYVQTAEPEEPMCTYRQRSP